MVRTFEELESPQPHKPQACGTQAVSFLSYWAERLAPHSEQACRSPIQASLPLYLTLEGWEAVKSKDSSRWAGSQVPKFQS